MEEVTTAITQTTNEVSDIGFVEKIKEYLNFFSGESASIIKIALLIFLIVILILIAVAVATKIKKSIHISKKKEEKDNFEYERRIMLLEEKLKEEKQKNSQGINQSQINPYMYSAPAYPAYQASPNNTQIFSEINELKNIIAGLEKQKETLKEEERVVAKEQNEALKELETFKALNEEKETEMSQKISDYKKQIDELKASASIKDEEYKKKEQELLNNIKIKEEQINETEKKKFEIEEQVKNLNQTLKEKEKEAEEISSKNKELNDKVMENENTISSLNEVNEKLKEDTAKYETENARLEEEASKFKDLAYFDKKYKTMNSNAFNRDIIKTDSKDCVLAMVSIRNMKKINESKGRSAGDEVIKTVRDLLVAALGEGYVYKIPGDQFAILDNKSRAGMVKNQLNKVKSQLLDMDINIVFGLCLGANTHKELINSCEERIEKIKFGNTKTVEDTDNTNDTVNIKQIGHEEQNNINEPQKGNGFEEISQEDILANYYKESE